MKTSILFNNIFKHNRVAYVYEKSKGKKNMNKRLVIKDSGFRGFKLAHESS